MASVLIVNGTETLARHRFLRSTRAKYGMPTLKLIQSSTRHVKRDPLAAHAEGDFIRVLWHLNRDHDPTSLTSKQLSNSCSAGRALLLLRQLRKSELLVLSGRRGVRQPGRMIVQPMVSGRWKPTWPLVQHFMKWSDEAGGLGRPQGIEPPAAREN